MPGRIMVVGRNVEQRARLARLLHRGGYRIEIAESSVHASRIGFHGIALAMIAADRPGPEESNLVQDLKAAVGRVLLVGAHGGSREQRPGLYDISDEAGLLARVADAPAPAPEPDAAEPVLQFAAYRLDLAGHSLTDRTGKQVPLTHGEFALLRILVQRPGRVLSREQLLQLLSGRDAEAYDRSIDMQVVRLRRKIEPNPRQPSLIVTVPNAGYKFAAPVRQAEAPVLPEPKSDERSPETAPARGERRYVTALAAEVVAAEGKRLPGDPEELRVLIDAWRRYAAAIVGRHGGVMAEHRVREVLAWFGYPEAQEHAADGAVYAALALAEHLPEAEVALPSGLAVRIGVAGGLIADLDGEVPGEAPSEAAHLQDYAEPGQVFIAESTRHVAGDLFVYSDLGPRDLKGVAGPVPAWQVLGRSAPGTRSEALHLAALPPLVGREEELTALLRAWQQAQRGEGRIVLLSGEPGIGKSRLLAALEEQLAGEPHASLRFFCSPLHQDSPLYPVIARLEREAGFAGSDTAADRLAKLEAVLAPTAPPLEDIALLAALLSIPTDGRYPVPELTPQRLRAQTVAALSHRLSGLARREPVLLLFEDAHWSDPSSIELLDAAIEQVPELPVLLVVSFRPEFVAPWFGRPRVSLMALSRLDRHDATALAGQVVKSRVLAPPVLDRIVTQSDGVPLFIEELTKAVLEAPEPGAAGTPLAVPETLQASLMARLDRLPAAKMVAQIGAVIGREFSHTLLAAVAELQDAQLTEGLDQLATAGLLFRRGAAPDAEYTFKHALVQDAAYGSLLRGRRQQLHASIAIAIESQFGEYATRHPEVLALHHQHAGNVEQSFKYWALAGDVCEQRGASSESVNHYRSACKLLDMPDPSGAIRLREPEINIKLGNALMQADGYNSEEGRQAFGRARSVAAKLELPEDYAKAGIGIAPLLFGQSRYHEFIDIGEGISTKLLEHLRPQTSVHLWTMLGNAYFCIGEFKTTLEYETRAAKLDNDVQCTHLNPIAGADPAVACRQFAVSSSLALGLLEQSVAWSEEAWAIASMRGHAFSLAWAGLARIRPLNTLGRYAEAVDVGNVCVGICERHGFNARLGIVLVARAVARLAIGEREEALADMRSGIALWRRTSGTFNLAAYISELVQCLLRLERIGEADQALQEAEELLGKTEEQSHCSEILRLRGRLYEVAGEKDQAVLCYQKALEWSRARHAKLYELRASTSLARLWRDQGRHAAARNLLAPVCGWFTDSFDAPDLKEAKALLDTI